MATSVATTIDEVKETTWIDAWIRWEIDSKDVVSVVDDGGIDLTEDAAVAAPTETYSFRYPSPRSASSAVCRSFDDANDGTAESDSKEDDEEKCILIDLEGFPPDSEQTWNSTGLTLWRSSHSLCEYLVNRPELVQGKNVVELGSGLGRCGILAHRMATAADAGREPGGGGGGGQVWLTDGDTDVLARLRDNVRRNARPREGGGEVGRRRVSCHQLLWGTETASEFLERHVEGGDGGGAVDVVLGSDLVYVPSVIGPLFDTVKTLLRRNSEGIFVMAHCHRRQGNEVDLDMVLTAARDAGFAHDLAEEEEKEGDEDISVNIFRRK